MKVELCVALSALFVLPICAMGQCARPEMNAVWDPGKEQFSCVSPSGSDLSSRDSTVSPRGNKDFCATARQNLLNACPTSDEGKACKSKAKSIFNACYKDFNSQSESGAGSSGMASQATKTDRAVCMQTFTQQQQACQSRRPPPTAPGQPYIPDTCLQDALTAQNKCLANSR